MIVALELFVLAILDARSATVAPAGLLAEERLIARIPDGLSLEGKPTVSPDGKSTVPEIHRVIWSQDGSQAGYVGLRGEVPHPVIGEQVGKAYDYLEGPEFSRDGAHWAFRAGKSVDAEHERWWVLLDGKETGAEDWIGTVSLALDGSGTAAWVQPGARVGQERVYERKPVFLVTPWRRGAKWDDADALAAPRFAPDGSFVTSLASKAGKWRLLLADKKGERELGPPQGLITEYDVSADGKAWALVVADPDSRGAAPPPLPGMPGAKTVIHLGKKVLGRDRGSAASPRLSPDGRRVAWVFREGGRAGVALDEGREAKARHDWIRSIAFRPDAKELAFAAGTGGRANEATGEVEGAQWRIVRMDLAGKETTLEGSFADIADLGWSGDGKRLAWAGKSSEGWRIHCGQARSDAFDEVGPPRFSPDADTIGHGARKGREIWWKILPVRD